MTMGAIVRFTVDLPSDLVSDMRKAVQSGDFASESEMIRQLWEAWRSGDEFEGEELEEVRAAVAEGIAEADAGRVIEAEDVHAELRTRIKAIEDRGK
jgi:antitoxin ParD1/3/4